MQKFGSIPFRVRDGKFELLFITSKKRKRWIFPKGNVKISETGEIAAERETFEEAGVKGTLFSKMPLISYKPNQTYFQRRTNVVIHFPMMVETNAQHWPEKEERARFWVELSNAHLIAEKPRTIDLIRQFEVMSIWLEPEIAALQQAKDAAANEAMMRDTIIKDMAALDAAAEQSPARKRA